MLEPLDSVTNCFGAALSGHEHRGVGCGAL